VNGGTRGPDTRERPLDSDVDADRDARTLARAVWRMSRPAQLALIVAVYALGVAIALGLGARLEPEAAVGGLLALVPTAASVHFANEWADYETDALAVRTPFSGGSGALRDLSLPPSVARDAAVTAGSVALVCSSGLLVGGYLPSTAFVALAAIAVFGWGYSLPPLALSRRGLGELDNALLGGLVLPHYGAATQGAATLAVCAAVAPFTLLVFANLLATQWPDRRADAAVGKYTLPTRWSPRQLRRLHRLSVAAAFLLLPLLVGRVLPPVVGWASLAALPFGLWGALTYTHDERPLPTVAAMVVLAVSQLLAWASVAGVDLAL
jgi:1,4-dihydroxy-2-naphthoate octaprenyltransferase